MSKKYTTNFLQDTNGSTGSANQVLISTSSGVDWVDGSGSSIIGGPYLPLAGGTMTGTSGVLFPDGFQLKLGTGNDGQIVHNNTNMFVSNGKGDLYIRNSADDGDIIFQSDNGSGGLAAYFSLDGSQTNVNFQKDAIWADNKKALFGGSGDLQIYHDGSNSYINETGTGVLSIQSDGTEVQINKGASEYMGRFITDAGVKLYYDNSLKFETTSAGVAVTGKISGLTAGTANTDAVNVQQLNDATTGALIFKGTWSAASTTTGVHAAGSTSTAIVLENPNLGVSVGSTVTGTGIPAGTTVTAVLNSAAFSLSASITMTNGAVATFTTVGGIPDLSQTARKVTGDYYICETAGVATPNGASTTPNEWAIGDWVAFSDLATDAWQKIDNSSVLSGAGTGGSVAGWSGSGTSVTLQDAPITFNASNNTIVTGKLGIGSLNASFNLYNEGTSYFNGAATVDAAFTQTGGAASTFSGNVTVGAPTTNGGVINLIQSSTNPEIRIQSGESGASVFSIYNTAVDPDVEQFFINNTLGSSHLGNQRGALKLEDSEGVNLTLNSGNATFAGTVLSGGFLVGQTSQYAPTGGGNVLATLARADAARINSVISNQSSSADASAALVLATHGHDFFVKGTSSAGGSKLTLGFNTNPFLTLTSSLATFAGVLTGPSADLEFIKLTAANPGVLMKETDTTDKNWDIQLNSGNLKFYEVNDARSVFNQHVTFQAGGNVGIGVTGPSTTLEVAGHITINSPAGASQSSYGLRLRKTNSSSAVQAGGEILASPYPTNTNAGNLIFKTANASANLTQRMVIDGVGNVGIGTASPDTELHVKGGATVANFEGTGGSVFIGLKDSDDGTVGYMGVDGGKIKFQTSGSGYSDKLVIDTVGNVGIGTATPTFKLHVDSNAASDNVAFIHHNNAAQSSGDVLKVRSDAGDNAGSALLNVQNNSGNALYVRGDRNVGIGTTGPSQELHVAGNARVTGAFYDSNNSPGTLSGTELDKQLSIKLNEDGVLVGTKWKEIVFTPDIWEVNNGIFTAATTLVCDTVRAYQGNTNTTGSGASAGEIRIVDPGVYEITYSVAIQVGSTSITVRQNPALYLTAHPVDGTEISIPGSVNSVYLRLPNNNQGGRTSFANTCYYEVPANTDISLNLDWLNGAQSVEIYRAFGIENTISIRKISDFQDS